MDLCITLLRIFCLFRGDFSSLLSIVHCLHGGLLHFRSDSRSRTLQALCSLRACCQSWHAKLYLPCKLDCLSRQTVGLGAPAGLRLGRPALAGHHPPSHLPTSLLPLRDVPLQLRVSWGGLQLRRLPKVISVNDSSTIHILVKILLVQSIAGACDRPP